MCVKLSMWPELGYKTVTKWIKRIPTIHTNCKLCLLGRLRDLQYICAVTAGLPSNSTFGHADRDPWSSGRYSSCTFPSNSLGPPVQVYGLSYQSCQLFWKLVVSCLHLITVHPRSSYPPEKIFNIFFYQKIRFTTFINYCNTLC